MLPGWTHTKPNSVASRVFFQLAAGTGGFQRSGPVGGRAYGIPLKTWVLICRGLDAVSAGTAMNVVVFGKIVPAGGGLAGK